MGKIMVDQIYQRLKSLNKKHDKQVNKTAFIIKILILLLVFFLLLCVMTWNTVNIDYGTSELGQYYMLSTNEGVGITLQWQIGYLGQWGSLLLWKCEKTQNKEDSYCYITWLVSWPPLQISNESLAE